MTPSYCSHATPANEHAVLCTGENPLGCLPFVADTGSPARFDDEQAEPGPPEQERLNGEMPHFAGVVTGAGIAFLPAGLHWFRNTDILTTLFPIGRPLVEPARETEKAEEHRGHLSHP
ncbi:MAG: hypothetical protein ABSA97_11760 [Verrucomicrobiia bacterium]